MLSKGKTVESAFSITLKDLKRDTVERILQEVVSREAARSSMQSKQAGREGGDGDGDGDDVVESENDKLVRLQHDSKGKPAPLPVVDEDFSPSSLKAAMKKVPVSSKQKRGKA